MPGLLDQYINQLRGKYGQSWEGAVGLPMPQTQQPQYADPRQMQAPTPPQLPGSPMPRPSMAQQGGVRSAADARDIARRGAADPTFSNISQSLGLAGSLMGGTGAITTGAQAIASQTGLGRTLGIDNPFKDLTGFAKPSAAQIAGITSDNPTMARNQAVRTTDRAYAEAKSKRDAAIKAAEAATSRGQRGLAGKTGGLSGGGGRQTASAGSSRGARGV